MQHPERVQDAERHRRMRAWVGLAVLAFLLRLTAALMTGSFHHPQLYEYDAMARSLLAGRGLVYVHHGVPYHSFVEPLYPLLCAGIYALTHGSTSAVLIVQMIAGAATAMLFSAIGERLFGRTVGVVSGLLVATHPGLVVYASLKAHQLTFDILCFGIVFWQLLRLQDERTPRQSVWTGLAIGLSILERATGIVWLVVGSFWLLLTTPQRHRAPGLQSVGLMILSAFLVVSPWLVRNAIIHHHFVFIRTNWEVFWRGNNPFATGHSYVDADRTVESLLPEASVAALRALPDEFQQAHWFRDQAFAFIRTHPGTFVTLTLKKFYQFWWFAPQSGLLYPRFWLQGYQAYYSLVLMCALLGFLQLQGGGRPSHRHASLLIGMILLGLSVIQSLYYVEGRHRWAIEPFLLLLAAFGVRGMSRLRTGGLSRGATHVKMAEESLSS